MRGLLFALGLGCPVAAFGGEVGRVVLELSDDARVEVLPHVLPDRRVVSIRGNQRDLSGQLDTVSTSYLMDASAVNVGMGAWLVSIRVSNVSVELRPERKGDRLVLSLEPQPDDLPVVAPSAMSELRWTADSPVQPLPLQGTLTFLPGRLGRSGYTPDVSKLPLPEWSLPSGLPSDLAETPTAESRERYERLMSQTRSPRSRSFTRLRIAESYLMEGRYADAAAQAQLVRDEGLEVATAPSLLLEAMALAGQGRAAAAKSRCDEAARWGISAAEELRCLLVVAQGDPRAPAEDLARATLQYESSEAYRALAATLLLVRGDPEEAAAVFRKTSPKLLGPETHALLYGEALYLSGQGDEALKIWKKAPADTDLAPLLAFRTLLVETTLKEPEDWRSALPRLGQMSEALGRGDQVSREVATEIAWTASRIHQLYGDETDAAKKLQQLIRENPPSGGHIEVLKRLLALCEEGVNRGARTEDTWSALGFFETCWDPSLRSLAKSRELVGQVSELYASRGLTERSMELIREVSAIDSRAGEERLDQTLALATRYAELGREVDTLETLDFLRGRRKGSELALVEAMLYWRTGELSKAKGKLGPHREASDQHRALYGLLRGELGECEGVASGLAAYEQSTWTIPPRSGLQVARARCLLDEGQSQAAIDLLAQAVTDDPDGVGEAARWLAAKIAQQADVELPEVLQTQDALWKQVGEVLDDYESLRDRIDGL